MHYTSSFESIIIILYATAVCNDVQSQRWQSYIDIEKLENEFVLTSAEYFLSMANVKWTFTGKSLQHLLSNEYFLVKL